MGRHYQVRAAAIAATGAKKSALYMRASKEIYVAAKSGSLNPDNNLALRSAIDKYRGLKVPKDVIERAIKKASGTDVESYHAARYEAFGPGNSMLIVDVLTDNLNRALTDVRTAITKKGGHLTTVNYNFTETGIIVFKGDDLDKYSEALVFGDVDIQDASISEDIIEILVGPTDLNKAKIELNNLGIEEFDICEINMIANETLTLNEEDKATFQALLDVLDELQDVQSVYHNVDI